MRREGFLAAVKPFFYALVFFILDRAFDLGWRGITPPVSALLRTLPGLLAFADWGKAPFRAPPTLLLYGAYAGAVLEEGGLLGAAAGLLLALLLFPLLRLADRWNRPLFRFFLALFYLALATVLFTVALVLLGQPSGWLLPLLLLLSEFFEGYAFDLYTKGKKGQKQKV